jgi:hypothetical protein
MNQRQQVLAHLKSGKTITSFEAFKLYDITRLGAVVFDLRKAGSCIEGISEPNHNGKGVHHRYFIVGEFQA